MTMVVAIQITTRIETQTMAEATTTIIIMTMVTLFIIWVTSFITNLTKTCGIWKIWLTTNSTIMRADVQWRKNKQRMLMLFNTNVIHSTLSSSIK